MEIKGLAIGAASAAGTGMFATRAPGPWTSAIADRGLPAGETASDTIAVLINGISELDLAKLLAIFDSVALPGGAARVDDLACSVVTTVAKGDRAGALRNLREIASIDPRRLELLRTDPALAAIRSDIDGLFVKATEIAKRDAELWLAQAQQVGDKPLQGWEKRSAALMELAHGLFDSGIYGNYLCSAELARAIVGNSEPLASEELPYKTLPHRKKRRDPLRGGEILPRFRALWHRAPLLVLLLSWGVLGLAGGPFVLVFRTFELENEAFTNSAYQTWGLGFLILVSFGFLWRVVRAKLDRVQAIYRAS
jgi:hypothetical protein